MEQHDMSDYLSFLQTAEQLKTVYRHNLTIDGRFENSAEHSWHTALMAMVVFAEVCGPEKDFPTADRDKVVRMLIIHDLVEIYAGDAFLFDDAARTVAPQKERVALDALLTALPEKAAAEIQSLWCEFENRQTDTAKFAACMDAIQPLINHACCARVGYNPDAISVEAVLSKKQFVEKFSPTLWTLVLQMTAVCKEKQLFS